MTILEMSVGGTLLIAAILVLRRIALYRLPKWSFLLLWVVALFRLLLPFSVPSQFSIYTGAAWIAQILEQEESPSEPVGEQPSVMYSPATVPGTFREDVWLPSDALTVPATPTPEKESVSPLTAIYLLGGALCGVFFVIAYGVKIRRFNEAEPVDSDFINQWQEEHPTMLPVKIKTCDTISSPMAYGLLWPVVLLPENTDWSDEDQLTYVLTHEYVHIRRGDLGWKLLLTAALCIHWFNPLVWIMYFRANQDLELACDEAVVRILGLDNRKNYAYALLAAAESGFSPFCLTYTTKNHMEERIRAIMKMKKKSTAVIICAAMLVAGISAVFATSPKPVEAKDIEDLPSAVMTDQTVKPAPAPAPVEQDIPQNTPSAPDTFAAPQNAPAVLDTPAVPQTTPVTPEQDAEPVQQPVDTSAESVADTVEGETDKEKEWGLEETRAYFSSQGSTYQDPNVQVASDEEVRELEERAIEKYTDNGEFKKTADGKTYAPSGVMHMLDKVPDLIGVIGNNGNHGYITKEDWNPILYRCKTQAEIDEFLDFLLTPENRTVPVYDLEGNIIDEMTFYKSEKLFG